MIIGAHLRNEAHIPDVDVSLFHSAQFTGALVPSYMGPLTHERLGISPENCVVRLADTEYKHWPSGQRYIPSYQDYARDCVIAIEAYYTHGYRLFVPDNEPNLSWPAMGYTVWDWAWFMEHALPLIRQGIAHLPGVKLGSTPLSSPQFHKDWWTLCRVNRQNSDFITLHCYWQAETDMASPQFGAGYRWAHDEMKRLSEDMKPIYITECANSKCQESPPPNMTDIRATFTRQYPNYVRQCWLDAPIYDLQGIFFYILGSNGDWRGFELDERTCQAIGAFGRGGGVREGQALSL